MPKDSQFAQCICGENLQYQKIFSPKSVSVFLLVVGCVGFCWYKGWEFSVIFFTWHILLCLWG